MTEGPGLPDRVPLIRGARGIRTPDLFHAMEARYQLRHSPETGTAPGRFPGRGDLSTIAEAPAAHKIGDLCG